MTETTLPTEDLQVLVDALVGSLDWSSGYLDNEEVLALQRVARLLGVDPMGVTPHNFNQAVADCEHDWQYADRTWHVKPGVTVGWHGRMVSDPEEELETTRPGDISILNTLVYNGNVTGPEYSWYRRCRKCFDHEDEQGRQGVD